RCGPPEGALARDLRDAPARAGRPESLRRMGGVPEPCDEVCGAGPEGKVDGAASPGGPALPVPRLEDDRRVRRARPDRDAQAETAAPARPRGSQQSAEVRESNARSGAGL